MIILAAKIIGYDGQRLGNLVKSVTRSIRIDTTVDQNLARLAKERRTSINQLITTALEHYTEWEALAIKTGFVEIHDDSIAKLFLSISEKRARELGHDSGLNAWTDMVQYLQPTLTYDGIIRMLELRGRYGRWFLFENTPEDEVDTLILKHQGGLNVTAFLAEAMNKLLERAAVKFELFESEGQLVVKVEKGDQGIEPERARESKEHPSTRFSTVRKPHLGSPLENQD